MPHRDPLLAARARCERLRARIAEADARPLPEERPLATLEAALAEALRLEAILVGGERGHRPFVDSDPDLAGLVIHDGEPAERGAVPIDADVPVRERRSALLLMLGGLAPIVAFGLQLVWEPSGSVARPPRNETTLRLAGAVVSHGDRIDVREGERCTITIADSGDRDAGRWCRIVVECPRVAQSFSAASCPIGGAIAEGKAPVRIGMNGLELDGAKGTATFVTGQGWGDSMGDSATLKLDSPR